MSYRGVKEGFRTQEEKSSFFFIVLQFTEVRGQRGGTPVWGTNGYVFFFLSFCIQALKRQMFLKGLESQFFTVKRRPLTV